MFTIPVKLKHQIIKQNYKKGRKFWASSKGGEGGRPSCANPTLSIIDISTL